MRKGERNIDIRIAELDQEIETGMQLVEDVAGKKRGEWTKATIVKVALLPHMYFPAMAVKDFISRKRQLREDLKDILRDSE